MFSSPHVRATLFAHRVPGRGAGFLCLGLLLQPAREFGDLRTGERSPRQDDEIGAGIRRRAHVALSEWQDQLPGLYPIGDEPAPPERNALTLDRRPDELIVVRKAKRAGGFHAVRLRQLEPHVPAKPRVTPLWIVVVEQYLSRKVLGRLQGAAGE